MFELLLKIFSYLGLIVGILFLLIVIYAIISAPFMIAKQKKMRKERDKQIY